MKLLLNYEDLYTSARVHGAERVRFEAEASAGATRLLATRSARNWLMYNHAFIPSSAETCCLLASNPSRGLSRNDITLIWTGDIPSRPPTVQAEASRRWDSKNYKKKISVQKGEKKEKKDPPFIPGKKARGRHPHFHPSSGQCRACFWPRSHPDSTQFGSGGRS